MNTTKDRINYKTSWLIDETASRSHITNVLQEVCQRYAIIDKHVLELGCGIGTNLQIFANLNHVSGVEGLESAVHEARARGIETIHANLELPLPLENQSVDWILCIDVLEHLLNPTVCLESAYRILREDGQLIINVPNHFDWRGRIHVLFGSGIDSQRYFPDSPHWEYPHVRFFQRESIEALLLKCGFIVQEDLSSRFTSFPKMVTLSRAGLATPILSLQRHWPDFFSAGFFLICRKIL